MTTELAKKIGRKCALTTCGTVLLIFILPSVCIDIYNQEINAIESWIAILFMSFIGPGVLVVFIIAFFLGSKSGFSILIKNKNWIWIGLKTGFFLLWIGVVISVIGMYFWTDDIKTIIELILLCFVFIFIVSIYACIPLTVICLSFGYSIKYLGAKLDK